MAGQSEVMRRFMEAAARITGPQTEAAITRALIQININTLPMIPVATSNLINSEFRTVKSTNTGWSGTVGYGANYAMHVHESPGTLKGKDVLRSSKRPGFGFVWDPDGEPEFLLKGAKMFFESGEWQRVLEDEYTL